MAKSWIKRKEETIMNRLQKAHTFLTHNHLMVNTIPPLCDFCRVAITVKHIISKCQKYEDMRNKIKYHKLA